MNLWIKQVFANNLFIFFPKFAPGLKYCKPFSPLCDGMATIAEGAEQLQILFYKDNAKIN